MERGGPVQWLDEGGLLVPLVAAAQVGATYVLAGRSPHVGLLTLAGSGTFLAYHLDRAIRIPTEDLVGLRHLGTVGEDPDAGGNGECARAGRWT